MSVTSQVPETSPEAVVEMVMRQLSFPTADYSPNLIVVFNEVRCRFMKWLSHDVTLTGGWSCSDG